MGSRGIKITTARGRAYAGRKIENGGGYGHMWLIKVEEKYQYKD